MADGNFRDIIFMLKDLREGNDRNTTNDSIFKKAAPAILDFPIISTDLISLEDLTMTTKALEREYATVVRLAMGLSDVIGNDGNRMQNKIDYIEQFHTNNYPSNSRSMKELFESMNLENLTESQDLMIESLSEEKAIQESLGLNMSNLNNMSNHNNNNYYNFSEADYVRRSKTTVTERTSNTEQEGQSDEVSGSLTTSTTTGGGRRRGGGSSESEMSGRKYNDTKSKSEVKGKDVATNTETEERYSTMTKYENYSGQLLDNDVKKANELLPTTLDITVYQKVGQETITNHILLGIKCVAHKVPSGIIVDNIRNCIESKKSFFRFIQWTTGEIKFFKDYLLCLDSLKKEALQLRSKENARAVRWFRFLKNQSTMSKIRSTFNLGKQLIPNSTLVVTMEEVDLLRNQYGIDLLNSTGKVNELMKTYFLIGFVIVDPSSEVVHFKFDAFDRYQTFSYRALERENRNQGNDIKALVSLMNKF